MKLKQALYAAVALCGLGVSLVSGGNVFADVSCPTGSVRPSATTYAECNLPTDATGDKLFSSIKNIINVILGILGVVAVVVIIYGGFTFMTSQGDAGKVMKGRNTILWGVIGLIVALMAFVVVNFVLGNINSPATNGGPGNNIQPTGGNGGPGNNIQPTGNGGAGNNIQPTGNGGAGNNIQPSGNGGAGNNIQPL